MKMNLTDLSQYKALYLEDEALIAMDGEEILHSMGFGDVYVAYNIDDAVRETQSGHYDFALLDVNLGDGKSSLPFARELIGKGTMVIFATGYNASEGLVDELEAPLVVKPFDEAAIQSAFLEVIEQKKQREGG
jgi:DNA-binding response OmpR family regulator